MSCGIYNEETKKNYLRYCMEYRTAWIEYLPQISETLRKFDGKKITKRIHNAIEKIDSRLIFDFERWVSYPKATVAARWYDYKASVFRDEETDEWKYVRDYDQDIISFAILESFECFNAEEFIDKLEKAAEAAMKRKEEVYVALDNLDELKAKYNETLAAFSEARENIPYDLKDFYKVDSNWISDWR